MKSARQLLHNPAGKLTNQQTDHGENMTSLEEVISKHVDW